MKILVTGGCGYIGSHTAVELINAGYEITIIDNLSNSNKDVINRIKTITQKESIGFFNIDLTNYESIESHLLGSDYSCVIHFAALKSIPDSNDNPIDYYHNNIVGTINLLRSMKKNSIKNIIFSSSASIYGSDNPSPFKESFSLSANNPYAKSKLYIEEIIKSAFISQDIKKAINLRYFNPVGAHSSNLIGESPLDTPTNIMPVICRVANGFQKHIKVFGSDYNTHDGTGVRDYIHIQDLALGHVKSVDKILSDTVFKKVEDINLGTGNGVSVLELIKIFQKVNNIDIPYIVEDRREGDIECAYADSSYAKNFIDWEAKKNINDMCIDAWSWSKL